MGVLSVFAPAAVFIETGLGSGQSLRAALSEPFETLHSIEIDASLIARCDLVDPRLTIHHGSSPNILPTIIDPERSTMFWLDAHYSAGLYTSDSDVDRTRLDPRYGQCPLLAELAIIRAAPWRVRPWIYIDDAECFVTPIYEGMLAQYDRAQYPTEAEVRAALPERYHVETLDMRGWAFRATPEEQR
jgi:hypothetical protein